MITAILRQTPPAAPRSPELKRDFRFSAIWQTSGVLVIVIAGGSLCYRFGRRNGSICCRRTLRGTGEAYSAHTLILSAITATVHGIGHRRRPSCGEGNEGWQSRLRRKSFVRRAFCLKGTKPSPHLNPLSIGIEQKGRGTRRCKLAS